MVVMQSKILFVERRDDIEKYFDFVKFIIDDKPAFSFRNKLTGVDEQKKIDIEMTHILKANMFILLYNLIEATAANAIEDIHSQLSKNPNLCVDQLCEKITKMALKRIDSNIVGNMNFANDEIAKLVLRAWLNEHEKLVKENKNPLFSGNVDARVIREVADEYGFSSVTDPSRTRNGGNLVKIKKARNSLAHGSESFLNKGQETSIDALKELKDEVFNYLEEILENIQQYLDGQLYLRPPIIQPNQQLAV